MNWRIEVTDKQAEVLIKALDVYSRMLMGQISTCLEEFHDLSYDDRQYIHLIARQFIYKELESPHSYYGIGSDKANPKAQIAWDIQQVVRQAVAWHRAGKKLGEDDRNWHEMIGLRFDEPLVTSEEPLCKIERIE